MATNSTSYANVGAPFNFLGHMTSSQKTAFVSWLNARKSNFTGIQQHHQIRAQVLRKTAGVLEKYYQGYFTESLAPSFKKQVWTPGADGHFNYGYRDDHAPMVAVSNIKEDYQDQLERQDEAVFTMNHVRTLIEMHEDKAQYSSEASTNTDTNLQNLDNLFSQPQYEAALVDENDTYQGAPRYRVNQLDPPTPWELALYNRTYTSPSSTT